MDLGYITIAAVVVIAALALWPRRGRWRATRHSEAPARMPGERQGGAGGPEA